MNLTSMNAKYVVYKCYYDYDNDEDRKKINISGFV